MTDQTPTADRAALRDRIRRALCEADGKGFMWDTDMLEPDEYGDHADMVLAVLPETADRAAVYREVADFVEAMNEGCGQRKPCHCCDTRTDVADELRRMADEAQPTHMRANVTEHNLDGLLRLIADFCDDAHRISGIDEEELVRRMEAAGYRLPDEEPATGARQDGAQS